MEYSFMTPAQRGISGTKNKKCKKKIWQCRLN